MKLAIIKFSVGGLAVLISYIVSVVLPWKEFGGIFATFPAVFLVSIHKTPIIPKTAPLLTCIATSLPNCIPVIHIETKNTAGKVANNICGY
jgi:hypothetical protein